MKLLVATNNQGKIAEFKRMLNLPDLELLTAREAGLPADFDPEETGTTFEENAALKAREYALATGLYTLADDSGLEVAALGGQPGVYSKRFAGENLSGPEINLVLLDRMVHLADEQREAQMVCVVVLGGPDGAIIEIQRGICPGKIAQASRGTFGFGFDPLFIVRGQDGRTLAEMTGPEKDRVSHRGLALRQINPALERLLAGQI